MLQAQAFYQEFKDVPFDKIYTSELIRTHETVASFIQQKPHEIHAGLNEISWGVFEGKEINRTDKQHFAKLIQEWKDGAVDKALEGGESPKQVAARQRTFVPHLLERPEEKNVLVCMHGRAMRIFLCVLLDLPLTEMDRFPHGNLCLYQLQMSANHELELLRANYTEHLREL